MFEISIVLTEAIIILTLSYAFPIERLLLPTPFRSLNRSSLRVVKPPLFLESSLPESMLFDCSSSCWSPSSLP